jgi:hypothetical protein
LTTDYTLSGSTVTFRSAPTIDYVLSFEYEVTLNLAQDFEKKLSIARLISNGVWSEDTEYVVVYTAGYGSSRATVQASIPAAVTAVLLIVSDLYENRGDKVGSVNLGSLGSVSYNMPSRAQELLNRLKVDFI